MIDRELHLPTGWAEDRDRCARAGIPAEGGFATKPQLGVAMLARAYATGVLAGWVTADEAYGQNHAVAVLGKASSRFGLRRVPRKAPDIE